MIIGNSAKKREPLPQYITYPFLSKEKCNEIIASAKDWTEGTVYKFGQFVTSKEHRSVQMSRSGISEEVEDNIFKSVFQVNNETFRYHLEGFYHKDPVLVFKYTGDRGDHYVWHSDLIRTEFCRKLSFSIQLSDPADYDGGDLEFMLATNKDKTVKNQGQMVLFPSFCTHRVTPVTRGTRYVIVGWMYGPEFR